jgi:hypothetical protein
MIKNIGILILSIVTSTSLLAQAAKQINFELGGPGLASFNFDTRFANKEDGLGGRIGFGGFSLRSSFDNGSGGTSTEHTTVIFIPIGLNYLLGKDGKNYFEIGGGATPVFASESSSDDDFRSTFGYLTFGYRMQPRHGGFSFRAFVCPIFGSFGFIPYYGGVSFGYKFGRKE